MKEQVEETKEEKAGSISAGVATAAAGSSSTGVARLYWRGLPFMSFFGTCLDEQAMDSGVNDTIHAFGMVSRWRLLVTQDWKPINANIEFGSWFGKSLPSNDRDEEKLPCVATLAQQAFKVPYLRYQYWKKFWIVSVTLAALVAHILFWNLLGRTDHRLRGSTKQSTVVRLFPMETGGHPRIHA